MNEDQEEIIAAMLDAAEEERVSECDACGELKSGCRDLVYMGMDTHACPECRGDSPENF